MSINRYIFQARKYINMEIINSKLSWDGSHLDTREISIISRWDYEATKYYGVRLTLSHISGIVYCSMKRLKDNFPYIAEDIKELFGLTRRGTHKITIGNTIYIAYFSPLNNKDEVIWETPLNRLASDHPLRFDSYFKNEIRKIALFRDALAIKNMSESNIIIRVATNGKYLPISTNEDTTYLMKDGAQNHTLLTKVLISNWFDKEVDWSNITKQLINYSGKILTAEDLAIVTSNIRNKIEEIIKKHDQHYVWYNYFIVQRLIKHLLDEQNS